MKEFFKFPVEQSCTFVQFFKTNDHIIVRCCSEEQNCRLSCVNVGFVVTWSPLGSSSDYFPLQTPVWDEGEIEESLTSRQKRSNSLGSADQKIKEASIR